MKLGISRVGRSEGSQDFALAYTDLRGSAIALSLSETRDTYDYQIYIIR